MFTKHFIRNLVIGASLIAAPQASGDLEDGLIAHFKLLETAGNVAVTALESVNLEYATVHNFPYWTATGLRLNGVSQYVEASSATADLGGGNAVTLAAWIRPERANAFDGIVSKGVEKLSYGLGMQTGGKILFAVNGFGPPGGSGWNVTESSGSVPLFAWSHVAVTYDGTKVRFYINGELDSEHDRSIIFGNVDEPLIIGADLPGGNEHFQGRIRDARVYNRPLTIGDIAELSPANIGTSFTGLWVGQATINEVKQVQSGTWGPAPAYPKQVLLHVDDEGVPRLLREAIIMKTRVTPPNQPEAVIITLLAEIPNYDGIVRRGNQWVGQRFSCSTMPLPQPKVNLGKDGDWLITTSLLGANHPLNPNRHKFHPDLGSAWDITRTFRLAIDETDSPDDDTISGTVWDSVEGLHKDILESRGPITFTRVTTSGQLK